VWILQSRVSVGGHPGLAKAETAIIGGGAAWGEEGEPPPGKSVGEVLGQHPVLETAAAGEDARSERVGANMVGAGIGEAGNECAVEEIGTGPGVKLGQGRKERAEIDHAIGGKMPAAGQDGGRVHKGFERHGRFAFEGGIGPDTEEAARGIEQTPCR